MIKTKDPDVRNGTDVSKKRKYEYNHKTQVIIKHPYVLG